MATSTASIVRALRASVEADEAVTDRELLLRFALENDQDAFTALVRRHAAMVYGVCRRALPNAQDAEDACQATFLVLIRQAGRQRWEPSLTNWLYTTARRVAYNARLAARRRLRREGLAAVPDAVSSVDQMTGRELLTALDEELGRLPARYREPLLLCYLEGLTRDEAAARLGVPAATLKSQLERGRKKLGDALTRRGCGLGAGILALAATSRAASGSPHALNPMIIRAAAEGANPSVAALVQGVFPMVPGKKILVALVMLVGLISIGVGVRQLSAGSEEKQATTQKRSVKATTEAKPAKDNTISGRVLDPAGKPVANAAIHLFMRQQGQPRFTATRVATTNAEGRFTCALPARRLTGASLVATTPGFASAWVSLAGGEGEPTLRLAEDVPIRGRLLDLEGKPVAGAVVKLLSVGTTKDGKLQGVFNAMRFNPEWLNFEKQVAALAPAFSTQTKTDGDGRFELKSVGKDRVALLRFEAPGIESARVYVVTQKDFDPRVVLPKPQDARSGFAPDLRLAVYGASFTHPARPSHDITGTVTDAVTGKPVANITLVGTAEPRGAFGEPTWGNAVEATTDKDGRFLLSGLPKAARRFLHVKPGDKPYLDRLIEVKDNGPKKQVTVDVKLDRCVFVQGQLTDRATGKAVPGHVHWHPLSHNPILQGRAREDVRLYVGGFFSLHPTGVRTDTDDEGRFRLRVPGGPGVLLARADTDRAPEARYVAIQVAEKDRKYLQKNERSDARSSTRPPRAKTLDRSLDDEMFATGTMSWPLRWENGYTIINPGAKDEVVKVEIGFDPGRSLRGKVVGPDGKPLAGALVLGIQATNEFRPTRLRDDSFTVFALAPGQPRELYFVHEGKKLVGMLTMKPADREAVVRMKPWATITGRVLTADGKPAAGAEITFQLVDRLADERVRQKLYHDRSRSSLRTDSQGRFRLEGMFPELEVAVYATTPGLRTSRGSEPVIPKAGETVDVGDLKLPSLRQ
jgi:RNA polymerase sigma factor (sigma-70 family)